MSGLFADMIDDIVALDLFKECILNIVNQTLDSFCWN